jgi:hypothetical protein
LPLQPVFVFANRVCGRCIAANSWRATGQHAGDGGEQHHDRKSTALRAHARHAILPIGFTPILADRDNSPENPNMYADVGS